MSSPVKQHIGSIALVVKEYDEAIAFYTQQLGFDLVTNTDLGNDQRWVVVAPPNSTGTQLLLMKATNEEQLNAVGNQAGGQVLLILHTNDFWRDYRVMQKNGVVFNEAPREEVYGTVVVFQDLYGNKWDLIQPSVAG